MRIRYKKTLTLLGIFIFCYGLVLYIFVFREPKPVFIPGSPSISEKDFDAISCQIMDMHNLQQNRCWIWTATKSYVTHRYLYDLKQRTVIGELRNADPCVIDPEGEKILAKHHKDFRPQRGPAKTFVQVLESLHLLQRKLPTREATLWLLTIQDQGISRVGDPITIRNPGGRTTFSPDSHYVHILFDSDIQFLFDTERSSLTKISKPMYGQVSWWSDSELIYKGETGDIRIYDIRDETEKVFLTHAQIGDFLTSNRIVSSDPRNSSIQSFWNGSDYDFFFSGYEQRGENQIHWLARIDKPAQTLQFMENDFPNHYGLGNWNHDLSLYLFCGRDEKDMNAVYLRDMATKEVKTLIPGDAQKKYFSMPQFYEDQIIFAQDQAIWIMDLDGNGQERLFPPVNKN